MKFHLLCLFGLLGLLNLTACSMFERSTDSGYAVQSEKSGSPSTPVTASDKARLKQLENMLISNKEVDQYSKVLPLFKSEQERIEFLSLPGFESRQKWLQQNAVFERNTLQRNDFQDLIQAQDIALGMPFSLVRQSWGEPDSVEISGNPKFRNERWKYFKYISTQDGFKPEKKIVYFEGGKVVGWEVE